MRAAEQLRGKAGRCLDLSIEQAVWAQRLLVHLALEFDEQALFADARDNRDRLSREMLNRRAA